MAGLRPDYSETVERAIEQEVCLDEQYHLRAAIWHNDSCRS